MLVIKWKDVSSDRFTCPFGYLVWHHLFLRLCSLWIKACEKILIIFPHLCSCWSSRWMHKCVHMLFLCPCSLSGAGSVLYFVVMQVLLFFYLSWLFHQWSQPYLWMTSMVVILSTLLPLLMVSHTMHILTAWLSASHLAFPALFLLQVH